MVDSQGIVGATVGVLTLKVAGDLITKGKKSGKKSGGKVKFSKVKF
jgi:hypothetical protein